MRVASGRMFSVVPGQVLDSDPSPQSIVAVSESSQPGSRIVPATVDRGVLGDRRRVADLDRRGDVGDLDLGGVLGREARLRL